MFNSVLPVIPSNRFSTFEKREYYNRPAKRGAEHGFEDMLNAALRVSKPL